MIPCYHLIRQEWTLRGGFNALSEFLPEILFSMMHWGRKTTLVEEYIPLKSGRERLGAREGGPGGLRPPCIGALA